MDKLRSKIGGLGQKAKIGIGIGIAVAVIAVVIVIVIVMMQKNNNGNNNNTPEPEYYVVIDENPVWGIGADAKISATHEKVFVRDGMLVRVSNPQQTFGFDGAWPDVFGAPASARTMSWVPTTAQHNTWVSLPTDGTPFVMESTSQEGVAATAESGQAAEGNTFTLWSVDWASTPGRHGIFKLVLAN